MADLPTRVERLRAIAMEHLPGGGDPDEAISWLICDRCGLTISWDMLDEGPPDDGGWGKGPEGDLCPTCTSP